MKTHTEFQEAIHAKVVELARAVGNDPSALNDDAPLLETGLLDSAAVLELLVWLEEEAGVEEMEIEDLEKLGSIARLAEHVAAQSRN